MQYVFLNNFKLTRGYCTSFWILKSFLNGKSFPRVEPPHLGASDERYTEAELPLHAARQLLPVLVLFLRQLHLLQQVLSLSLCLRPAQAFQLRCNKDVDETSKETISSPTFSDAVFSSIMPNHTLKDKNRLKFVKILHRVWVTTYLGCTTTKLHEYPVSELRTTLHGLMKGISSLDTRTQVQHPVAVNEFFFSCH